jgi:hypothetical protein
MQVEWATISPHLELTCLVPQREQTVWRHILQIPKISTFFALQKEQCSESICSLNRKNPVERSQRPNKRISASQNLSYPIRTSLFTLYALYA